VQLWIVDDDAVKLRRILEDFKIQYPNMEIKTVKEVKI